MKFMQLLKAIAKKNKCTTGEALEAFLTVADYTPGDWRVEDLDKETVPRVHRQLIDEGWNI
jgi:hypothetical protein